MLCLYNVRVCYFSLLVNAVHLNPSKGLDRPGQLVGLAELHCQVSSALTFVASKKRCMK